MKFSLFHSPNRRGLSPTTNHKRQKNVISSANHPSATLSKLDNNQVDFISLYPN